METLDILGPALPAVRDKTNNARAGGMTERALSRKAKAETVLLAATLIWGSTFAAVKIVLAEVSALQMVAIRFGLATLVIAAIAWKRIFPIPKGAVIKGSILGLFLFLGFVAQTIGLQFTTASKSAFITGMMVVFVPLLQFIIERRPPKLGNIIGVASVAVGLWFLTSPSGSAFNAGDALTVVCAVVFGVYIVYLDVISHDMTPEQLTFLQFSSNAVFAVMGIFLFQPVWPSFSAQTGWILLYLCLFATLLTTYVQTRFQKDTTPTRAVVIFAIEPVFATIFAYFILGENLGAAGIIGGGLIVCGILLSEFSDSLPVLNKSFGPDEP